MAITPCRCCRPRASWSGKPATATAKISATPSKRRIKPRTGLITRRIIARRSSITSPRIWRRGRAEFAERIATMTEAPPGRCPTSEVAALDRTGLSLGGLRRQMRRNACRKRPCAEWSPPFMSRLALSASPARTRLRLLPFRLAGRRRHLPRQHSRLHPLVQLYPLSATDLYQVLRYLRLARRRGQYHHRRPRSLDQDFGLNTTMSIASGTSAMPKGSRQVESALGAQYQAHLGQLWRGSRLVRCRPRRRGRVSCTSQIQVKNIWVPTGA